MRRDGWLFSMIFILPWLAQYVTDGKAVDPDIHSQFCSNIYNRYIRTAHHTDVTHVLHLASRVSLVTSIYTTSQHLLGCLSDTTLVSSENSPFFMEDEWNLHHIPIKWICETLCARLAFGQFFLYHIFITKDETPRLTITKITEPHVSFWHPYYLIDS